MRYINLRLSYLLTYLIVINLLNYIKYESVELRTS